MDWTRLATHTWYLGGHQNLESCRLICPARKAYSCSASGFASHVMTSTSGTPLTAGCLLTKSKLLLVLIVKPHRIQLERYLRILAYPTLICSLDPRNLPEATLNKLPSKKSWIHFLLRKRCWWHCGCRWTVVVHQMCLLLFRFCSVELPSGAETIIFGSKQCKITLMMFHSTFPVANSFGLCARQLLSKDAKFPWPHRMGTIMLVTLKLYVEALFPFLIVGSMCTSDLLM